MIRRFLKCAGVFAAALSICAALLVSVCALIPHSAIEPAMREAEAYFSSRDGFPVLWEHSLGTRADNYADIALFDVIHHVDSQNPVRSVIAAPYYRNEGRDIREDFHDAVVDKLPPNSEYSRYWHGSQVLLRPLLLFTSIQGCRLILFALLLGLNAWLAVLLVRRRALRPLLIYVSGLLAVHFWMGAFTLEYIMTFLVMTASCIAVTLARDRCRDQLRLERRMTVICIVSGVAVCFMDFLTAETLSFTVPALLWFMLCKENGERFSLRRVLGLLVRWGAAWLCAYAAAFAVKWALVYLVLGKDAFLNALTSAAYRVNREVEVVGAPQEMTVRSSSALLRMLAHNIGCLFPVSSGLKSVFVLTAAGTALAAAGAALYLFRGKETDGAFVAGALLIGLVPYVRFSALSSHSLDHYFFTYRAQMAAVMAVLAVLAYSLKPSEVLGKKKRRKRRS